MTNLVLWTAKPALKQTEHINFKGCVKGASDAIEKVASQADPVRRDLLTALESEPEKGDLEKLRKLRDLYLSLLVGALERGSGGLTSAVQVSWSNTFGESVKKRGAMKDLNFDYVNIVLNCALWESKRASCLALRATSTVYRTSEGQGPPENILNSMRDCHKLYRQAAGLINYAIDIRSRGFAAQMPPNCLFSDSDATIVLPFYKMQFLAEAQEVALWRALTAKQPADVTCPLAASTSTRFEEAADLLSSKLSTVPIEMSKSSVEKFIRYCKIKQMHWKAVARCFQAELELSGNAADRALRCIADAQEAANSFSDLASKDRSSLSIPDDFFHWLSKLVATTKNKIERENILLHHKKPAALMPEFPAAQYGLAEVEAYSVPTEHALWQKVAGSSSGGGGNSSTAKPPTGQSSQQSGGAQSP